MDAGSSRQIFFLLLNLKKKKKKKDRKTQRWWTIQAHSEKIFQHEKAHRANVQKPTEQMEVCYNVADFRNIVFYR